MASPFSPEGGLFVVHPAANVGAHSFTHHQPIVEKPHVFVRPCWRPISPQDSLEIIERHPWALLVSNGEDGPLATNLPLLIDRTTTAAQMPDQLILVGHIARANHHLSALTDSRTPVLAIFEGSAVELISAAARNYGKLRAWRAAIFGIERRGLNLVLCMSSIETRLL